MNPLSISLPTDSTKTSTPLISDGFTAEWRFVSVDQKQTDKGVVLGLRWDLVKPAPTTSGITLNPGDFGSSFFENIQLYDKHSTPGGPPPEWAVKKIASRIDACLGTGDPGNSKGKPTRPTFDAATVALMTGKVVLAKMKVKTGEYEGNEFGTLYYPGDVKA